MWSEDIENDDIPFLEDGIAREARWSEDGRCKVARNIGCASVGIIAFGILTLGWRAFDRASASLDEVLGLSEGYDCLGKAEVLDDIGKQWCCSKGLIPCGEASRLAEDSHDLFSEDLPDMNRDLLDAPHFPPETSSPSEDVADSPETSTEEEPSPEFAGEADWDGSFGGEVGETHDSAVYSDAPSDWNGEVYQGPSGPSFDTDWHSDDLGVYEPDAYSKFNDFNDVGSYDHVVHHVYNVPPVSDASSLSHVDCHAGLHHYNDWSPEMKAHCCATQQVGCQPMEFHCKETDGWEQKWSSKQKAFCCATTGKGCQKAPSKCHTSSVNQPILWEKERRDWCCLHAKVGCPSFEAPYNCKSGTIKSRAEWSPGKKQWCCDHFFTGCSEERKKLYDCKVSSAHAIAAWPDLQKAWCCHNEQVGCHSSGHIMAKFDCVDGYSNWQRGWSSKKKAWCCAKAGKGCEKHYDCEKVQSPEEKEFCGSASFDCKAGYSHWKALWTSAKKDWCCSAYGRGCAANDAYDCSHTDQLHTWSESQTMWCCQHRGAGCGAKRHFDCFAGYDNWKEGWSSSKMVYCCDHLGMGCEQQGDHYEDLQELHISGSDDYDCTAGYENWKKGWSQDKQSFCCGKYKLGCPKGWSQHQVHFGHHWSSDWSRLGHHVWATHESHHSHGHHGHHGPMKYDCITDYEHWQVSWSSQRAKFCCQTYSVACEKDHADT